MKSREKPKRAFDPRVFLIKANGGRTIAHYDESAMVFSQGDPADAIFYIQEGKVKLTGLSKQGKEAVVAILGAGDFFGEGCLASQPVRMATATAMTDCLVVETEKAAVVGPFTKNRHSQNCSLPICFLATFGSKRIWWISCSIPVKSVWHGCSSCWRISESKARHKR